MPAWSEVVKVIGLPAAQTLVAQYGGTRIYISVHQKEGYGHSKIARAIGEELALKLFAVMKGDRVDVPSRREHVGTQVLMYHTAGLRIDEIALLMRITRRRVYQILALEGPPRPRGKPAKKSPLN